MKMTALKLFSITMTALLLGACDKPASPEKPTLAAVMDAEAKKKVEDKTIKPVLPALVIETASPDQAVKSWWRVLDLKQKNDVDKCNESRKADNVPPYAAYLSKVVQGDTLRTVEPRRDACIEDLFEREIQEVKTESETRAIVFAKIKNVTPIPAGAEPGEYDKEWRRDGFRYKYLVEKASDGWKVSQVYRFNEFNAKYKVADTWEASYKRDDRPRYRSHVGNQ